MRVIGNLLERSGVGRQRVQLRWVSAAEGQLFANYIKELSESVAELGPFDASKFSLQLGAVESVLKQMRVRWLVGMDRQITERENVYHQKLNAENFQSLIDTACDEEYEKALIVEALGNEPMSVREISAKTGLGILTVSQRLVDVERGGAAELHGYQGTTPKFARIHA